MKFTPILALFVTTTAATCPSPLFRLCTLYTDAGCRQEARGPGGEEQDDRMKYEAAQAMNGEWGPYADKCVLHSGAGENQYYKKGVCDDTGVTFSYYRLDPECASTPSLPDVRYEWGQCSRFRDRYGIACTKPRTSEEPLPEPTVEEREEAFATFAAIDNILQ